MLAPHAVDIAVIISSLIASLCFTFAEPFDDIFLFVKSSYALVSGNTNKSLRPKELEGRKEGVNLVPRASHLTVPWRGRYDEKHWERGWEGVTERPSE